MLSEPYLARKPPKSTGRELFHMGWLDALEQLVATVQDRKMSKDVARIYCGSRQGRASARRL